MANEEQMIFTLTVESGEGKSRRFVVPPQGARLGRSSQNDFAIPDPLLSRHHCRFEFRGPELWAIDLGSANQTCVNNQPITEVQLHQGDLIQVGDTVIRVTHEVAATSSATAPIIDLGLNHSTATESAVAGKHAFRPILWTITAVVIFLIAATYIMLNWRGCVSSEPVEPVQLKADHTLQIIYEKIEGNVDNIFRYEMSLSPGNLLAVRIDDLSQNRHVRKEKRVDPELVADLARSIESSGFFLLEPTYLATSLKPSDINTWDITIILGRTARRCRVANRSEPDNFRAVREKIETFGKNELGIWAIQFSAEKLTELAHNALLVARKNYDERDIRFGNLFTAIKSYREAEFYLDTVDPKPEFYAEIVSDQEQAIRELNSRYDQQRFRADRAINLQEWENAAQALRILREMIPDTTDDRYKEATRKLLDVETRLKTYRR
jgi:hypothetical protein